MTGLASGRLSSSRDAASLADGARILNPSGRILKLLSMPNDAASALLASMLVLTAPYSKKRQPESTGQNADAAAGVSRPAPMTLCGG